MPCAQVRLILFISPLIVRCYYRWCNGRLIYIAHCSTGSSMQPQAKEMATPQDRLALTKPDDRYFIDCFLILDPLLHSRDRQGTRFFTTFWRFLESWKTLCDLYKATTSCSDMEEFATKFGTRLN